MRNKIKIAAATALIALFSVVSASEADARCGHSRPRYYSSYRRPVVRTRIVYRPVYRERVIVREVPVSYGYGRGYGYGGGYRGGYNRGYSRGYQPAYYSSGYNNRHYGGYNRGYSYNGGYGGHCR